MPDRRDVLILLREAAELEHQIMVQYLFAAYSLKTEPDEFSPGTDGPWRAQRNRAALEVWSAAETHAQIREYLRRTLGK
jgi:hypothetical protein